jgi:putative transposase
VQLATDGNHAHCFLRAAPRYSPSEIMNIAKSITAKQIFGRFPELKKQLWGGEFWGDGYYVATVGDGITADIIQKYIANQGKESGHKPYNQLKLF